MKLEVRSVEVRSPSRASIDIIFFLTNRIARKQMNMKKIKLFCHGGLLVCVYKTFLIVQSSFEYVRLCKFLSRNLKSDDINLKSDGIKLSVNLSGAWWSVFGLVHWGSTVGLLLLQRFRVGLLLSTRLVSPQWWILIYMFAVLNHWWVEDFHADRTTSITIWTSAEPRMRLLQRKTGLSPPPPTE